jgi:chaperonin GroEL (HSP60 family)
MATTALANIVKSSLGPVGLDKMIVDEVCHHTITTAIILFVGCDLRWLTYV